MSSAVTLQDVTELFYRILPALERNRSGRYLPLIEIAPEQIRAARALLRLEQTDLARPAHVSVITIRRLEAGRGRKRVTQVTRNGVHRALEAADASFNVFRAISLRSAERQQDRDLFTDADFTNENGLPP